jgi:translation initiation factor IF-1
VQLLGEGEVWESLRGKAVRVKVEEGRTVTATVRLITESDFDEK